jgi:hypothetical protein
MDAYSVVRLDKGVIDGDDLDFVVLDTAGGRQLLYEIMAQLLKKDGNVRIAEDDTSNATEAVDSDLNEAVSCL